MKSTSLFGEGIGGLLVACALVSVGCSASPTQPTKGIAATSQSTLSAATAPGQAAVVAQADAASVNPTDLINQGWSCRQSPVPDLIGCSRPNQGFPSPTAPPRTVRQPSRCSRSTALETSWEPGSCCAPISTTVSAVNRPQSRTSSDPSSDTTSVSTPPASELMAQATRSRRESRRDAACGGRGHSRGLNREGVGRGPCPAAPAAADSTVPIHSVPTSPPPFRLVSWSHHSNRYVPTRSPGTTRTGILAGTGSDTASIGAAVGTGSVRSWPAADSDCTRGRGAPTTPCHSPYRGRRCRWTRRSHRCGHVRWPAWATCTC